MNNQKGFIIEISRTRNGITSTTYVKGYRKIKLYKLRETLIASEVKVWKSGTGADNTVKRIKEHLSDLPENQAIIDGDTVMAVSLENQVLTVTEIIESDGCPYLSMAQVLKGAITSQNTFNLKVGDNQYFTDSEVSNEYLKDSIESYIENLNTQLTEAQGFLADCVKVLESFQTPEDQDVTDGENPSDDSPESPELPENQDVTEDVDNQDVTDGEDLSPESENEDKLV